MTSSTAGSVTSSTRHTRHHHRRHHGGTGAPGPGSVYSEHETEHHHHESRIGTRSQSLTALQPSVMQPRMARLETLEAKMASIEVSLSSGGVLGGRRRKVTPSPSSNPHQRPTPNHIHSANKENSIATPTGRTHRTRGVSQIGQQTIGNQISQEGREREDRLRRLRGEAEQKRLAIKNIRLALDRLDITDNIDVRIRQAELEYQLGREELNLLTITEEIRRLQLQEEEERERKLRENTDPTNNSCTGSLHSLIRTRGGRVILLAVEVSWDRHSGPRFGVKANVNGHNNGYCIPANETTRNGDHVNGVTNGVTLGGPGLLVDWVAEGASLRRGDRVIEVNGRVVMNASTWSRDDLARALATRPSPAFLVVLRSLSGEDMKDRLHSASTPSVLEVTALREELNVVRAESDEARKAKDGLRADNLRLTHRISYLEEQVQELLEKHKEEKKDRKEEKKESVTSVVDLGSGEVVQVYGKGSRSVTSRSVRSLDLDTDYASEPSPVRTPHHRRPPPPKKPLRLSLHRRAQSLQSVDGGMTMSECTPHKADIPQNTTYREHTPRETERAGKRTHRGECAQGTVRWSNTGVGICQENGKGRTVGGGNWC